MVHKYLKVKCVPVFLYVKCVSKLKTYPWKGFIFSNIWNIYTIYNYQTNLIYKNI